MGKKTFGTYWGTWMWGLILALLTGIFTVNADATLQESNAYAVTPLQWGSNPQINGILFNYGLNLKSDTDWQWGGVLGFGVWSEYQAGLYLQHVSPLFQSPIKWTAKVGVSYAKLLNEELTYTSTAFVPLSIGLLLEGSPASDVPRGQLFRGMGAEIQFWYNPKYQPVGLSYYLLF
jgi:hypothetical protein